MADTFAFVPNARNEISTSTIEPEPNATRLRLAYDIEIQSNGAPAAGVPRVRIDTELKGPGDIIGFSRAAISRVEPSPGLRGFESNYFPLVEFVDADFPWRYTLDTSAGTRVQPWIVLIVLAAKEFEFAEQGQAPLPRIRVFDPSSSLPDIRKAWMFAHVQLDLTSGGTMQDAVNNPGATFSRLLAPRRLAERTGYHMFLVPAYEAGRRRGLGDSTPASPFDAIAWDSSDTTPVELPVYFQSHFTTNDMEDVETLIRRLRAITDEEAAQVGKADTASAASPGYYPGYANPGETFEVQAALKQPGSQVEAYSTDPELASRLATTLEEVIAGEMQSGTADGPDREDPLVAMPPYGWRYQYESTVDTGKATNNDWFDRINLDLKFRLAAGTGARLVREKQEAYAQKCWEQYEEILDANRQLQRLQWAQVMVDRVSDNHLAKLPSGVMLNLTEPLHAYVRAEEKVSVHDALVQSGIPTTFTGRSIRRISAKRHVAAFVDGKVSVRTPQPRIPGADLADGNWTRRSTRRLDSRKIRADVQERLTKVFRDDAFASQTVHRSPTITVGKVDTGTLTKATISTLKQLPMVKGTFTIGGRLEAEEKTVAPIYRSPLITRPLVNDLEAMAREFILAGSGNLPDNTVSAFEENRLFVEAFLVGANHEMNNELRWQEFPTDMRGTIFRRFWDRAQPDPGPSGDDIAQVHEWTEKLGQNVPPGATNHESDLVLVIRGDLVRKLDTLIVELNESSGTSWQSGQGNTYEVQFSGRLGPDTMYFGFDVSRSYALSPTRKDKMFLIIYEPVGRLRFGLDIATAEVRRQRRNPNSVSLSFPVAALDRSYANIPSPLAVAYQPPPANPASWNDLSWSHVDLTDSDYIDSDQNITVGSGDDLWGSNRTSASIARSFWQKPLAAVLPLKRVL